jgi:hypothetical protein
MAACSRTRCWAGAINRRLVVNLLRHHLASGGRVIFDDGHQGLHTIYDGPGIPQRPRLWGSLGVFLAFWVLTRFLPRSRLGPPFDAGARARQTTSYACWRHFCAQGFATGRRPAPDR